MAGGNFPDEVFRGHIIAQVIGARVTTGVLFLVLTGKSNFVNIGNFAANVNGRLSSEKYYVPSDLVTEFILTMLFFISDLR